MRPIIFLVLLFICSANNLLLHAQHGGSSFRVIPLGVKGGSDESNLSSYLVGIPGSNDFVCLDAGTINYGVQQAIAKGLFKSPASAVIRSNIKAYLISHPHLDHVAGLIINSPDDSTKNIYGLPFCLDVLKDKYFSWKSWANFADAGEQPALGKYHYRSLSEGVEEQIEHSAFFVKAYTLSHGNPYKSTAFLLRHDSSYLLYLGDTGADSVEGTNNLQRLWASVAPLIKSGQLKAIFIEVSFGNAQPQKSLFGHLTPALLMQEMHVLANLTGNTAIKRLQMVITHEKPDGYNREIIIQRELNAANDLHLSLVFPSQANALTF